MDSRRSTVRSALLELEKEGMVQRTPYSSWAVPALTQTFIWEIYTFRGAVEGLAAELVPEINDEKRNKLESAYAALNEAETSGAEAARVEADLHFHRTIRQVVWAIVFCNSNTKFSCTKLNGSTDGRNGGRHTGFTSPTGTDQY